MLPRRNTAGCPLGPEVDCLDGSVYPHPVPDDNRGSNQEVLRESQRSAAVSGVWQRRLHLLISRGIFNGVDPSVSCHDNCHRDILPSSMALYPPEILNYAIRANGYTVKQYCNAIPAYEIDLPGHC